MKFEMFLEALQPEEALQSAGPHLRGIFKPEVVPDQRLHLANLLAGASKALQDFDSHLGASFNVPIEPNTFRDTKSRGLAYVVQ
jgi:hypothetical protein